MNGITIKLDVPTAQSILETPRDEALTALENYHTVLELPNPYIAGCKREMEKTSGAYETFLKAIEAGR